jgi:hypothetical protein
MMSEMVERIALALYESLRDKGASPAAWVDDEFHPTELVVDGEVNLTVLARAALEAMRDPTKGQAIKGQDALDDCVDESWDSGGDGESCNSYTTISASAPAVVYRAMIDAALEDPPPPLKPPKRCASAGLGRPSGKIGKS